MTTNHNTGRTTTPTSSMMQSILTLLTLSLAATGVNAYGTPHTSVVELTTSNFQTMLEDPANGLFLLKFYAPWVRAVATL
jgi:hypothetical protein